MKINKLRINGFGKLQNKEIELKEGMNIVYGENEAGKSTLLKFIASMFYGVSKNKNGQKTPDREKYEPWEAEEFSGKINYTLENGQKYEVYRDFKKTNPKIFNEQLEDISKTFSVDKTKGNQFFSEQTGMEEAIFTTSVISKQGEVQLDEKSQNHIIQKISNILGTGEDTSSYEKIAAKLKKKLTEEVGTNNTKERPINIVESRIAQIKQEKAMLEHYQNSKFAMEAELEQLKNKLIEDKQIIASLQSGNMQLDKLKSETGKVEGLKQLLQKTEEEIKETEDQKPVQEFKTKVTIVHKIVAILMLVGAMIAVVLAPWMALRVGAPVVTLAYLIYLGIIIKKENKEKLSFKESKKEYQRKLEGLQANKALQEKQIKNVEDEYTKKQREICEQYHIVSPESLLEEISRVQSNINETTLKLHTLEIDNSQVAEKLESFVALEEELENLEEQHQELEQRRVEIQDVMNALAVAYGKMKEEVTPKFTDKLSAAINKISNGKYKKVRINVNGDIMVEQANGEYIDAENLSLGTVDQLYLSLRLATIEEMTQEKMPIILDEAFAYYDNERMKNILTYLAKSYADRQIIIFTCSKREIELLNNENLKYNLIEL